MKIKKLIGKLEEETILPNTSNQSRSTPSQERRTSGSHALPMGNKNNDLKKKMEVLGERNTNAIQNFANFGGDYPLPSINISKRKFVVEERNKEVKPLVNLNLIFETAEKIKKELNGKKK